MFSHAGNAIFSKAINLNEFTTLADIQTNTSNAFNLTGPVTPEILTNINLSAISNAIYIKVLANASLDDINGLMGDITLHLAEATHATLRGLKLNHQIKIIIDEAYKESFPLEIIPFFNKASLLIKISSSSLYLDILLFSKSLKAISKFVWVKANKLRVLKNNNTSKR